MGSLSVYCECDNVGFVSCQRNEGQILAGTENKTNSRET